MSIQTLVADSALRTFAAAFRGQLIRPEDTEYEGARQVWNGMIDRKPGLIAQCTSVHDVATAVRFARDHKLLVAVRGGGHSASGLGVCDDGLVIDLSLLQDVQVDPGLQIARAGGGTTYGKFDAATQAHGLATTGGLISTTGLGGLTLGGGLGWLMRSYGMACDNLTGVELVTADGTIKRASAADNAELFWGVRGGGGNFGVVTTLEYQLHKVGPVLAGMLVHPFGRAREALRFYRDFTQTAPDELTVFAGLMHSPEGMPIVAFVLCYNGDLAEGERVLRPLRAFGPPLADQVTTMPYVALQSMLDRGFPGGMQVYWRSEFLKQLSDDAIDVLIDQFGKVTSPLSALLLEHFGGAVRRVHPDETAYDQRDADYNLVMVTRWTDPAEKDRHTAWARELNDAVRPFLTGRLYVNYIGVGESADRVRAAYGAGKYERLVELKRKYDPTNLFRVNQNIRPE
jgi:FAD/FMN-containing dehydrogenase